MKRSVLNGLALLLVAGSLRAEQASSATSSDTLFYWLAAGISSPRIQRLTRERGLACHLTPQYTAALKRAGADTNLIQNLGRKSTTTAACPTWTCSAH